MENKVSEESLDKEYYQKALREIERLNIYSKFPFGCDNAEHFADEIARLKARIKELENETERERMRLAACGTAALGYFKECHEDYRSASLEDTLRLYGKYESLKKQSEALAGALEKAKERIIYISLLPERLESDGTIQVIEEVLLAYRKEQGK